jgi:hypothetical protein
MGGRMTRCGKWLIALVLCASNLACWSSNTMFIHLTETPTPRPTATASAIESLYQVGATVAIISEGVAPVYLTHEPEPATRRNRVPNAACYSNSTVEITAIEEVDGVTYYHIACNNTPGWVAEEHLGAP